MRPDTAPPPAPAAPDDAPMLAGARGRVAAVAVGALFGLAAALQHHVDHRMAGEAYPLVHSLARSLPWWVLWGLMAPLVERLALRLARDGGRPLRALAAHVGWALALTLVHLVAYELLSLVVVRGEPAARLPGALAGDIAIVKVTIDLATYGTLVVAVLGVRLWRRLHARELQAAELRARAGELEASLSHARLDALRAQLQPHFLFNTLNAITVLVRKGALSDADRTLGELSDLLRAVLDADPRAEVPLAEELALVDRYLAIQRVRFGDRLSVVWDVPDDVSRALVPRFVLQPLVENAVEHGVSRARGRGTVEIVARRDGDALALSVRDDGPGPRAAGGRRGVGLPNTRDRLAQLYGDRAALHVEPRGGGGTIARVSLPLRLATAGVSPAAAIGAPADGAAVEEPTCAR